MDDDQPLLNTQTFDDDATRLSSSPLTQNNSAKSNSEFSKNLTTLDIIGQGGAGRVYLAYDETIGRRVAVKELLEEIHSADNESDIELRNSFIHEAKITGKLEHPGIVPIYELSYKDDGRPYYVMRYVRGDTLEQKLKKVSQADPEHGFINRIKLLDDLIGVCDTLAYAHSKGVIHRDLKPGNIICGNFGETVIIDWGLAQVLDDEDNTYFYREALTHQRHTLSDTTSSEVSGTPAYMAPEQFNGITGKTGDVYSLGIILFRIITGTLPYRGSLSDIHQQIAKHANTPSPKLFNPAAPPELIAICEKAAHKNPLLRFANAEELAGQLKDFRDGRMVNIYSYSKQELLHRFLAHNKFMVFMTALLFTAIIAGAGFSVHYAEQMEQAKTEAEQALVLVATYGNLSQLQARTIAQTLKTRTDRLFSDLTQEAVKFGAPGMSDQSVLEELRSVYPNFESFSIRKASEISAAFSISEDENAFEQRLKPRVAIENDRLSLIYRVPIEQKGRIVNYLEAKMYPEKVLPNLLPSVVKQNEHPRNIWIMRNDGLILFDETPKYIGTNIFIDTDSNKSPALQAFGRLAVVEDDSIGYYSFIDGDVEYYKIAAWDSVDFGKGGSWKIIVAYTYMHKELQKKFNLF